MNGGWLSVDKERVALLVSKEVQQDVTMEDILKIDKVGVKFSWELWLFCVDLVMIKKIRKEKVYADVMIMWTALE